MPEAVPGQRIVRIHTDKGTEFLGEVLQSDLRKRFVYHTHTVGYDPKANGTAECFVNIVKAMGRKLTLGADLREKHWPYALEHGTEHARALVLLPKPKKYCFRLSCGSQKDLLARRSQRFRASCRHRQTIGPPTNNN